MWLSPSQVQPGGASSIGCRGRRCPGDRPSWPHVPRSGDQTEGLGATESRSILIKSYTAAPVISYSALTTPCVPRSLTRRAATQSLALLLLLLRTSTRFSLAPPTLTPNTGLPELNTLHREPVPEGLLWGSINSSINFSGTPFIKQIFTHRGVRLSELTLHLTGRCFYPE